MRKSQIIWSWMVTALGLLWTIGGFMGAMKDAWQYWLMCILGLGLLRLGYNLRHPDERQQ